MDMVQTIWDSNRGFRYTLVDDTKVRQNATLGL